MKIIQSITSKALLALCGLAATSCDDFLDLVPMNEIVQENYWTEKADVESAVNGCYAGLEAEDCLRRMFVWGEMRSDNVTTSGSTAYADQQIIKENILETTTWSNWQSFYQVINRCNTVIYYAPVVAEKDPNYTQSEMRATIAEMTALRALCYFYLIRTFRDVPYVTWPSKDDSNVEENFRVAPTAFATVLSALIADLEAVQDDAYKLYPDAGYPAYDAANTSRVTTCTIYTLLADLHLWNGDYERCMEYCDKVIDYKLERYNELIEDNPSEATYFELVNEKYPLLLEQPIGNTLGRAYNTIFGTGNSFESIFELYFQTNQTTANTLVSAYYGPSNGNVGSVSATSLLATGVYDGTNELFKATDCRVVESLEEKSNYYAIRKYVRSTVFFTLDKNATGPKFSSQAYRSSNYANWILYRYTDVLLMKAEAEVELYAQNSNQELLDDAFQLVSAIYNRANNLSATSSDALQAANFTQISQMRKLILDERQREFLFEGKRWYDLVRTSLRLGNNATLVEAVIRKQKENSKAIQLKLAVQDALFFPYQKSELDVNPKLTQNPAYITNETSSKQ